MLRQPSLWSLAAFGMNDLRIDQDDLGFGIFLEGTSITAMRLADADLRRRQADAMGGVHRLEHVVDQLPQFVVETVTGSAGFSSTGSPNLTIG